MIKKRNKISKKRTNNHHILFLMFLIVILPFYTCKKFHPTVIQGKLVNYPIRKGISGETIVLESIQTGAVLIPDKAKIELITKTDEKGNFIFSFEAYKTTLKQRQTVYAIHWPNLRNKKSIKSVKNRHPNQTTYLNYKYNNQLTSFVVVSDLGENSNLDLNVVVVGTIRVNCINELSTPSNLDTCEIRIINQLDDFYLGTHIGTGTKILDDSNYFSQDTPPPLIPGTTTLRAIIKKNNQTIIKDTTFFAEDKEYYFEFRY